MQNPADFITHYGNVYFDDDVDTSLFSVPQFRGCDEALQAGHNVSGIYTIFPAGFNDGLQVYCDMETDGGGWIVIQRRLDGSVDFYRNWTDYQVGFGSLSGEFWLGNDNLRSLTETEGKWQLRIDLEDWESNTAWAEYDDFKIHGGNYVLQFNSYSSNSTAPDSLKNHNGMMFSTKDRDNDKLRKMSCARYCKGAWWYKGCHQSNLNGKFGQGNAGAILSVSGVETSSYTGEYTFYAAENRAVREFAFASQTVQSRVICGRECSMDERCKSFNFYDCNKMCELNLATRREHPKDFNATLGSVYFDEDEDTPLYSLTDSSFDRFRSCKMLFDAGYRSSGIYTIYPERFDGCSLRVYCDMETDGGGWIVFQRRQDGSVYFYRKWAKYQSGFGDLSGEFWLGNDNLVTLTSDDSQGTWELRVDLGDWENNTAWAKYSNFKISPGEYNLTYDRYINGTAGDSLLDRRGDLLDRFSTKDHDNDAYEKMSCAKFFKGACGLQLV
ncbi:angiopoietin-related protein 3-like [Patiria miniata]|uniref:Uncharacterized protein n=1 Tax=Patiria miniata TaxID=46514 RepID=A0A914ABF1_PATMI|nr:angiopoietin-related protein 3-like [Patiria miniata]